MLTRIIDRLRHETRFVIHIATRDLLKHLAGVAMILVICWYAGWRAEVFGIAALILMAEVVARIVAHYQAGDDDDPGTVVTLIIWTNNVSSTLTYLLPAVLLAGQPSLPLMLGGFMWLFGIYVHISNTFVALPLYNWSQMIPGFSVAMWVFATAETTDFGTAPAVDWWIAAGLMVVYSVNTFETMNQQKDTQRALDSARAEANARLQALEHMSRHDALTGLLNRRAFDESLEKLLARRKSGQHVGVFLIDLDGFKPINDTYSHEAGDTVLIAIAARLQRIAGEGEGGVAARLGGDEFALAIPSLGSERAALRLAAHVTSAIEAPITYGTRALRIAASIGIGLTGTGDDSVSGLCAGADQAMYRAKSDNQHRAMLFDPGSFAPRLSLNDRQRLSEALQRGEIRPCYQPKVDLDTGAVVGFEALARWFHPQRGILPPADFLPQINELGLQGDFLIQIARHVLGDVSGLIAEGLAPGTVSINIPEVTLATQTGRADLDALLAAYPQTAGHITFEITEDVFIARAGDIIKHSIAHFRRAGVRISLDDFGTGFASFQHLRQLEFDELKIDTSFVRDLGHDPAADVLVAGFLSIAHGLGVSVIAEGVETAEQHQRLRQMGCRFAQGYRFGRALPLDEVRILLFAEASRSTSGPHPTSRNGKARRLRHTPR